MVPSDLSHLLRWCCSCGGGADGGTSRATRRLRPSLPGWDLMGGRDPSQDLCHEWRGGLAAQSPDQPCLVPISRRGAYLAAKRARANAATMRPKSRRAMSQKTWPPSPFRAMLKMISLVMIPPSHPATT